MKKITALLLAMCMLFMFAACSGGGDADKVTVTAEETTEPLTTEPSKPEPVVLVEDEYLALTVIDAYTDEELGYVLKATVENRSDKKYCYSIESCSINGVSVDAYFYTEVEPGKKGVEKIEIDDSCLKGSGIGEYTDIELELSVQEDILEDAISTKTVSYYPLGKDKAVSFVRQPQATDKVLVNNEYITITAVGMSHDDEYECTELMLYIVNNCDKDISFDARAVSVNDIMIDPCYSDSVAAGKVRFSAVSFEDYELEDKDITEFAKIEMELSGYGEMDYLEMLENISLEDLFSEDSDAVDLLGGISLFTETVVYEP